MTELNCASAVWSSNFRAYCQRARGRERREAPSRKTTRRSLSNDSIPTKRMILHCLSAICGGSRNLRVHRSLRVYLCYAPSCPNCLVHSVKRWSSSGLTVVTECRMTFSKSSRTTMGASNFSGGTSHSVIRLAPQLLHV
jgi:hypothetical protein